MSALGHLRIGEIKLSPGQEWMDTASAWHFLRVRNGAAYWLGEAGSRALSEGEILVVKPSARGAVRASQLNVVLFEGFNFAPGSFCGFLDLTERRFFESGQTDIREDILFFPSTHPVARQFAAAAAVDSNSLSHRAEVLRIVATVFDEDIARLRPSAPFSPSAACRFEQIIAQMPDAEIINHSPDQLARLCGCSPRHFNRLFRARFGKSARARLTELRLVRASQLLNDSDDDIAQVATNSGYRNLGLFNALFKRHFSMTPSQWRNQAKPNNQ